MNLHKFLVIGILLAQAVSRPISAQGTYQPIATLLPTRSMRRNHLGVEGMKRANNIYRIVVVTLMVVVALLPGIVFPTNHQTARALPLSTATCSVKGQLPQSICDSPENCKLLRKTSENGYSYAFNIYSDALAVLKPDGQLYGTYDIAAVTRSQGIHLMDYVPFNNEYILFVSLEGKIYKYILSTRTLVAVTFQPQARFLSCAGSPVEYYSGLSRLGQGDNILACQASQTNFPELYGLDLVTFNQTSLSITTIGHHEPIRGSIPWTQVIAGQDGFVYLQPNSISFPSSFLSRDDSNVVTRYNLQTQQWSIIRLPSTLNVSPLRLALIDSASNMYFEHFPFDRTTAGYRLTKVSPAGQIIWQTTEQDVGSDASLVGISSNGNPLLSISSPANPVGLIQECAITTVGTPAASVAPSLTPTREDATDAVSAFQYR